MEAPGQAGGGPGIAGGTAQSLPSSSPGQAGGGPGTAGGTAQGLDSSSSSEWAALLADFPGIGAPFSAVKKTRHRVRHIIETTGRPVTARFRRLDGERLKTAKAEFDSMLKAGIIRR